MAVRTLSWVMLSLVALAAACFAAANTTPEPATADGLVAVKSRTLDEVYVRPNADLPAYKKVMVEPGRAALAKNWLNDINSQCDVARWLSASDAQQIAEEAAASLAAVVVEVFKAQGYEIASAPGPGVLRLSPSVMDLYVNAPYRPSPGVQRTQARNAGEATLRLDVRDSVTGQLLARIVDRSTAQEIRAPANAAGQLVSNPADNVTNKFWFEALYRQWAGYCSKAIALAPAREAANARP